MIRCLTRHKDRITGNRAFTLTEMMMGITFSVILMTAVFSFYNASSQDYASGINSQSLQDSANILLTKIIEGQQESGTTYRLATATAYYIPNGTSSTIYFCQDNPLNFPCSQNDVTARHYALDPTNTSVRYYHPTSNPLGYDVIYTAPAGSTLKIRFSPAQAGNPAPPPATVTLANVIEIDVDLTRNLAASITNARMITSGDASTFVLMRNHP